MSSTREEISDGSKPLLSVHDLTISDVRSGAPKVLVESLTFSLHAGETLGVVGESGSGKSLTAKAILNLLPPGLTVTGDIRFDGEATGLWSGHQWRRARGGKVGMIFQDPFTMLNPLHRCGDHIAESLPSHTGKQQSSQEVERLLKEVGISDPAVIAKKYPFELSGGMRQRVGIASVLAGQPSLLIADEPTTALDSITQVESVALLKRIQAARGMGMIFITHDLRLAFSTCDRVLVLYAGGVLELGSSDALVTRPMHPYTRGLLLAEPPVRGRLSKLIEIPGSVPRAADVQNECRFSSRCQWVQPRCRAAAPPLVEVDRGHFTACIRIEEIQHELVRTPPALVLNSQIMAGTRELLSVEALTKAFRSGRQTTLAVDGVSLHVNEGESVALVGESGSGKSTIGRCIVGLERPDTGEIKVSNSQTGQLEVISKRARRHRSGIQMIFQDPYSSLNPALDIGQALAEAVRLTGRADVTKRVQQLLGSVGLPQHYAKRRPTALSGGERQRVAIARALAVEPRLIVCDEVVSALDVSVQAQILNLLVDLRRELGLVYLFITHDLAVARQVTDRVYVLRKGKVVEEGPTSAVLDRPSDSYTRSLVDAARGASGEGDRS
jgi:peptide/nickel transport system ATP-binding protein